LPGRFLQSTIIIVSLYSFPTPVLTLCTSLFRVFARRYTFRIIIICAEHNGACIKKTVASRSQ